MNYVLLQKILREHYEMQDKERIQFLKDRKKKYFGDLSNTEIYEKMKELQKQFPGLDCYGKNKDFCPGNPSGKHNLVDILDNSNDMGCTFCGCLQSSRS